MKNRIILIMILVFFISLSAIVVVKIEKYKKIDITDLNLAKLTESRNEGVSEINGTPVFYSANPEVIKETGQISAEKSKIGSDFKSNFKINKDVINIKDFVENIDNWKVYKNNTYGFDVKYPDDWYKNSRELYPKEIEVGYPWSVVFSTTPTGAEYEFNEDGVAVAYNVEYARINFWLYKKIKDQTIEDWFKEKWNLDTLFPTVGLQIISLGGKKFIGSKDFNRIKTKTAFFELKNKEYVLVVDFINKAQDPIKAKEYSMIFYSLLDSLTF